jgi:pilus assembly protein CpaE
MLRIAIVDPTDSTREPLRNLLLGMESLWMEAEGSRYEFFPDIVEQSKPDVGIIALDADQSKALQLISRLKAEHPNLPTLAISAKGDGQSILQALRAGAKEFLTQPVVLEELLLALQRISPVSHANGASKSSSLVVAVLGSRGGIGCTTLAVNLGCSLAQDKNHSVALIDLDLAMGDADVALDLIPDHTLADVAQNIERLDMQFLRRALCKHATGLALLPHPLRMEELGLVHEDHVQRLIGLLRASYTHLILDLSKSFAGTDLTALRLADVILLVTQLELSSIRNAVRLIHNMAEDEAMTSKLKIVLNRFGSDFWEGDIDIKKAEETIGKPFYWKVPNDFKAVMSSRAAGVPLLQRSPKSKVQLSIGKLADALCGKAKKPVAPGPAEGTGSWWKR